ncbi:hypothetical protein BATDEDRAFT_17759 [Batrachochytrium dendrobatidis JAM81]|uniref:CAAX prenyl protease n=2 Tax=Batrachochytrium dendrobatidis TaxID=109871 RepID=F4PB84_BATDJ|nr:zinc metalloprotease [Batrachochytrium dendrobatidis JAM81]EGF77279.1 hypothetical protein BATDEDRAFT_17759 [Batrachochytrium dendrobatidis JAM81]KAK5669391.1 zinc metalloprotease [Batrachochytrium dendrobatidis]OAJ37923.1 hypothetical protein BDEG_21894 [Batrachochytrium dendrobatidis JEL423]|eukprot:XP_006681887.1 hypothetical protein BATDEDRAFT_17759 [Batrachochytrium dendrobatidis JAM81]
MGPNIVFGIDLDVQPWKEYVLIFSFIVFFWETYLNVRQHKKLGIKTIPAQVHKAFEPHTLSIQDFEKSRHYSYDKSTYNFIATAYSQLETTLIFSFNLLPWVWTYAGNLRARLGYGVEAEILQSVIFAGVCVLASTVINLPLSLYYTFVLEVKHGFNKQTLGLYLSDSLKSLFLTAVIGGPVLSVFLFIIQWAGSNFYFYTWIFFVCFQLAAIVVYPTFIQPLFNKFDNLPEGELKVKIDQLAADVKFPLTKVFVVDGSKRSSHSNAYFFGFFKNKRIVIFDTLLEQATHSEVIAILAHELGHWHFGHIWKRLIVIQSHLFVLFYLFSKVITLDSIYTSFGFDSKPIIIGFLLFQFIFTPVESVMGFIMNLISRHDEFQADAYAKNRNYATDLKNGLIKIHLKNSSNLNPDKLYSIWHYSHPPLVERLSALLQKSKSD